MIRFAIILAIGVLSSSIVVADSQKAITSSATGQVVTNISANGGYPFDGRVDDKSDLEDLLTLAWGEASLGLHRGHREVRAVLETFLGISHDEMHVLMEDHKLNLAKTCEYLGFEPEKLIESLAASFNPFIQQGVDGGVITAAEAESWKKQVRAEFSRRVYWEG
ncbi:hypothetical protein EOL70_11350 [Leucothrix sargassi]|nr:hypothetical protein EOL70_11350 [Leucothrix sargassi]